MILLSFCIGWDRAREGANICPVLFFPKDLDVEFPFCSRLKSLFFYSKFSRPFKIMVLLTIKKTLAQVSNLHEMKLHVTYFITMISVCYLVPRDGL